MTQKEIETIQDPAEGRWVPESPESAREFLEYVQQFAEKGVLSEMLFLNYIKKRAVDEYEARTWLKGEYYRLAAINEAFARDKDIREEIETEFQGRKTRARDAKSQFSSENAHSPTIDRRSKEEVDQSRQLYLANEKVKMLMKKMKYKNIPTEMDLRNHVEQCRYKSNGKINFSKLGKTKLGVSNHTAKRWCEYYRIE